jgi:hypothetical protein
MLVIYQADTDSVIRRDSLRYKACRNLYTCDSLVRTSTRDSPLPRKYEFRPEFPESYDTGLCTYNKRKSLVSSMLDRTVFIRFK